MNSSNNDKDLRNMSVEEADGMVKYFESQAKRRQAEFTAFTDDGKLGTRVIDTWDEGWDEHYDHLRSQRDYVQSETRFWKCARKLLEVEREPIDVSERVEGDKYLELTIYAHFLEVRIKYRKNVVLSAEVTATIAPGRPKEAKTFPGGVFRVDLAVPKGSTVKVSSYSRTGGWTMPFEKKRVESPLDRKIDDLKIELRSADAAVNAKKKELAGARQKLKENAAKQEIQMQQHALTISKQGAKKSQQESQSGKQGARTQEQVSTLQQQAFYRRQQALNTLRKFSSELPMLVFKTSLWEKVNREIEDYLPRFLDFLKSYRHVFAKEVTEQRIESFPPSDRDLCCWAIHRLKEKRNRLTPMWEFGEGARQLFGEAIGLLTARTVKWAADTYDAVDGAFNALAGMDDIGFCSCEFHDGEDYFSASHYIRCTTLYCTWAEVAKGKWYGEAVTVVRVDPGPNPSPIARTKSPRYIDLINALKGGPLSLMFWYTVNLPWDWAQKPR